MSKTRYLIASSLREKGILLHEHIVATERDTLRFRLLALVIATVSLYFWQEEADTLKWVPATTISIIFLVYTLLLGRVIIRWAMPRLISGMSVTYLVMILILVDTATLSAVVYLVGGPKAIALILIPLFIIYHSIYLGYLSALLSATLYSVLYITFAYLLGQAAAVIPFISLQVPSVYLVAVISGYLSEKRLKELLQKHGLRDFAPDHSKDEQPDSTDTARTGSDIDAILHELAGASSRLTGISNCLLTVLDERGINLVGRAANVDPGKLRVNNLRELVFRYQESSVSTWALRTGQPVVINNAAEEELRLPAWAHGLGVKTILIIPMATGMRTWGIMYLYETGTAKNIPQYSVDIAKGYAQIAARAIANARSQDSPHQ